MIEIIALKMKNNFSPGILLLVQGYSHHKFSDEEMRRKNKQECPILMIFSIELASTGRQDQYTKGYPHRNSKISLQKIP